MDSQELKTATLNYLLFRRNFLGAFTESFNGADVLGITHKLYTWEFEVKTSKEDLAKELKAIRFLTGNDTNFRRARAANKISKHKQYLGPYDEETFGDYFVPNYFSFVVPKDVADYAARGIEGTPYGIYSVEHDGVIYSKVTPKKIHEFVIEQKQILSLIRKASTENLNLREKLRLTD